jgi:hypothetical protein
MVVKSFSRELYQLLVRAIPSDGKVHDVELRMSPFEQRRERLVVLYPCAICDRIAQHQDARATGGLAVGMLGSPISPTVDSRPLAEVGTRKPPWSRLR